MPSLGEMPTDLLSAIALFLGRRIHYDKKEIFGDLLTMRCTSKAGEEAVRLAVKRDHASCTTLSFSCNISASGNKQVTARSIATMSRIFGGRLTHLAYSGHHNGPFPTDVINPLRDAVLQAQGRLVILEIWSSAVSPECLLEMCRASPLLTRLCATGPAISSHLADNMDEFATAVSSACPLLEDVAFPTGNQSRAESYQMHFPRTKSLCLKRGAWSGNHDVYEPTRWDKIEISSRNCEHAKTLDLYACWISSELAGLLLRGNLRRVECLNLSGTDTDIEPATILQLAAGLEALAQLYLPNSFNHSPGFYVSLARARPTLKFVTFGEDDSEGLDDASLAALCENLALERLMLDDNSTLTAGIIDIILASQTAQTLIDVSLCHVDAITSANLLRLARGCPKLTNGYWYAYNLKPLTDNNGQNVDDLTELLKSRAAQSSEDTYFEIEVFKEYGPWKSDNWRYRSDVGVYN